jgi:hypothetical protein
MKRWYLLVVCTLFFCLGCATDADKAQWNEALKDLRGDNMQMKSDFGGMKGMGDQSDSFKSRN